MQAPRMTFEMAMVWAALGATREVLLAIENESSAEAARTRLAELKAKAKKAYRRLALVHHPDRGGEERLFKLLASAFELLELLDFRPRVPVAMVGGIQVVAIRVVRMDGSATTSSNSYTSTNVWR